MRAGKGSTQAKFEIVDEKVADQARTTQDERDADPQSRRGGLRREHREIRVPARSMVSDEANEPYLHGGDGGC